jgi:ribose transport system substrate-binding protein
MFLAAKPYIPIISKGFQHQFWQAVQGRFAEARPPADLNVDITFEGPESESEVDKQIEMLQAALARTRPRSVWLRSTAKPIPLLEEGAKAKGIPVIGFDSGVDSDIPSHHRFDRQYCRRRLAADKMAELIGGGQGRRASSTTRPAAPASTAATALSTA